MKRRTIRKPQDQANPTGLVSINSGSVGSIPTLLRAEDGPRSGARTVSVRSKVQKAGDGADLPVGAAMESGEPGSMPTLLRAEDGPRSGARTVLVRGKVQKPNQGAHRVTLPTDFQPRRGGAPYIYGGCKVAGENGVSAAMSPAITDGAPLCVSVVEDDEVIRATLAHRISSDPGCRVLDTFSDAETALEKLPSSRPNVVLMDINLPGIDGVECVRLLKPKMPEVYFLMLTVYEDGNRLFKSLMAGASGYLLKRTSPEKLLAAVREVCSGGAPMTPEIARRVVQHFQHIPEPDSDLQTLSPRETDVLVNLSKGFTYKEIAEKLGITTGTLQGYITNVYQKLHVHSRTEAVVKYLNRSLTSSERTDFANAPLNTISTAT